MRTNETPRRTPWLGLIVLIGLLSSPTLVHAQAMACSGLSGDAFPCSYQIDEIGLARVSAVFKLQARVAQAKLPVGEGEFSTVVVQVLRGQKVLCMESFANVKVVQSVLNLRIGENMNCELDEIIAENQDLAFRICLGGDTNCLEAIDFSATPYAIKATYAHTAETADKANTSAQAHYAHRMTADRDLFLRHALGTGYLDFHTQAPARVQSFYDEIGYSCPVVDDTQECAAGGFLQWTPIRDADALHLHIAGKRDVNDELRPLETMVFASEETYTMGNTTTQGKATIEEGLYVTDQGAHVVGASDIAGTLVVSAATTIESGGLTVEGGGAHVTGPSDITGTLAVSGATTIQSGGLTVSAGGASITGDTTVSGAVGAGGLITAGQGLAVTSSGAQITGDVMVSGDHRIGGALMLSGDAHQMKVDATGQVLDVHGQVRFHDSAEFVSGMSEPSSSYVRKENETDHVSLNGGLTVRGPLDVGVIARSCVNEPGEPGDPDGAYMRYGCLCEPGEYPISGMADCPVVNNDDTGYQDVQLHVSEATVFTHQVGGTIRLGWAAECSSWLWGVVAPVQVTAMCLSFATTPGSGETAPWEASW